MKLQQLVFNPSPATYVHLDINSCFATIEQQANPFLRGKPVAVCAYVSPRGCVLAASKEAKLKGVKTGMNLQTAARLCPGIIAMGSDPDKYRDVHIKIKDLLQTYSPHLKAKSIDEFVFDIKDFLKCTKYSQEFVAREIKEKIKKSVGEWITVSIGVGPSPFIAKIASNYRKPDGYTLVDVSNYLDFYGDRKLVDLHGINYRLEARLKVAGIHTPLDLLQASIDQIRVAFKSAGANYWYLRIKGYDIDSTEFTTKSVGNSYSLPQKNSEKEELLSILQKLVEKTGFRLRKKGFTARGVFLGISFTDGRYWSHRKTYPRHTSCSRELFKRVKHLLDMCPFEGPVRLLSEGCFDLLDDNLIQLDLTQDLIKNKQLTQATDDINKKWGLYTLFPARMLRAMDAVPDRIAFGKAEKY